MTKLDVTERDDGFHVRVQDDDGATEHDVRIPDGYAEQLGLGDVEPSALVEASFRFLLERESKGSIMRTFDLPVIERYFSEYRREITRRLTNG